MNETPQAPSRSGSPGATSVGVLLIGLGLLFFIGQQLGTDVTDWGWPLFVILPGLAILTVGLTQRSGPGLAIAGSIVTMIGLVLLFQKLYDAYQTWAYAWALVGPGGSGLGMLLYGTRSRDRKLARDGFWTVVTGLAIFAVGFIFFSSAAPIKWCVSGEYGTCRITKSDRASSSAMVAYVALRRCSISLATGLRLK